MLKKILISALAALLVTAIGFSVYNVMAKGSAAALEKQTTIQEVAAEPIITGENQSAVVQQSPDTPRGPSLGEAAHAEQGVHAAAAPNSQGFSNGQGGQGQGGLGGAKQGGTRQGGAGKGNGRWGQNQNGTSPSPAATAEMGHFAWRGGK